MDQAGYNDDAITASKRSRLLGWEKDHLKLKNSAHLVVWDSK